MHAGMATAAATVSISLSARAEKTTTTRRPCSPKAPTHRRVAACPPSATSLQRCPPPSRPGTTRCAGPFRNNKHAVSVNAGIVAPKGTPKEYIDYWTGVFKKAAEDKGLLKQMAAKGTDIDWVGPKDYRMWAEQTYKDYEKVAIKIGMYKK